MSTITTDNLSLHIEGWGGELDNEEMDLEFQAMREYDEIIQAIIPASPPSIEDLQQEQKQEEEQATTEPNQEGCTCACCRGTCACGRGHACDEEEDNWRDNWYYEVQQGGLEWNESGYYD